MEGWDIVIVWKHLCLHVSPLYGTFSVWLWFSPLLLKVLYIYSRAPHFISPEMSIRTCQVSVLSTMEKIRLSHNRLIPCYSIPHCICTMLVKKKWHNAWTVWHRISLMLVVVPVDHTSTQLPCICWQVLLLLFVLLFLLLLSWGGGITPASMFLVDERKEQLIVSSSIGNSWILKVCTFKECVST